MIDVKIHARHGLVTRFDVSGHAGYAASGKDIVCAAVSALVTNAINSVERFAGVKLNVEDYGDKLICLVPPAGQISDAQLLLKSMAYGIEQIVAQYPRHVRIKWIEA